MHRVASIALVPLIALVVLAAAPLLAGPDVIVGSLHNLANYAADGEIDAFAVGTTSCNVGDEVLDWFANTPEHPVIAQNMYRLKDGRFEQVGMSWLKHGFTALQLDLCDDCTPNPGGGTGLGIGCSDPYGATLNGSQDDLGPRWEVNATTGEFPYPPDDPPYDVGSPDRRLQVHIDDLDPLLNDDALYFVEGHYVTADDAAAGNGLNNASWRAVSVSDTGSDEYSIAFISGQGTVLEEPAILAWQDEDPDVALVTLDVLDDGRFIVAYKVTETVDGTWAYEYAVQNLNSEQSGGSLAIPIPDGLNVVSTGFHDVDYHSGEPYSLTDWEITTTGGEIRWSTEAWDDNEDANALRWSTLYNFRFECNAAPADGDVTLGLFKPGTESEVVFTAAVPSSEFSLPPESFTCASTESTVLLEWVNGDVYDLVSVYRDDSLLAELAGDATTYADDTAQPGFHVYEVRGLSGATPTAAASCLVEVPFPLLIGYPNGVPDLIYPSGQALLVSILAVNGNRLDQASPELHYDIGAGFVTVELEPDDADRFVGSFPAIDCGTEISWYVTAMTAAGDEVADPAFAPATAYASVSAASFAFTSDDMETDEGWTVGAGDDGATSGVWDRVTPVGTAAQPSTDHSAAPGTTCWVTGQGLAGGSNGAADVDGGKTTLFSPEYALSELDDPVIGYWRWFSNDQGASPNADELLVEISDDGSTWVEAETVGPTGAQSGGGWYYHEIRVLDFVAATDTVQLRFVASDLGSASIVEAAIDDLQVSGYVCALDCNGNGSDDVEEIALGLAFDCNGNSSPDECDIDGATSLDTDGNGVPDECEGVEFSRGDCNADGGRDISDPIAGLGYMFLDEGPASCEDACDIDDDGRMLLNDMIALLAALFISGEPPAAPYPGCGSDPTADGLGCGGYDGACP